METIKSAFQNIFEKLNVLNHDYILIMSDALKFFQHRHKIEFPIYFDTLKSFIEELTLQGKTIILPSFTYQFCTTREYDRIKTRTQTGAIPNSLLTSNLFERTYSPLTSHLIGGGSIPLIYSKCSPTTFGKDTVYHWLVENNGLILNLGLPISSENGWIITHHVEEEMKVPYRQFKKFDGKIFENSVYTGQCSQMHYVRTDAQKQNNYLKLNASLKEKNLITEYDFQGLYANSLKASDVYDVAKSILKKNPYALLS